MASAFVVGFMCECGHAADDHGDGGCTHACTCEHKYAHDPDCEVRYELDAHYYGSGLDHIYLMKSTCGVVLRVPGEDNAKRMVWQHKLAHRLALKDAS